MKKILLLFVTILPLQMFAQCGYSFEDTVAVINNNIRCCSVPYSETLKLTGITVTRDGILTATQSDGSTYQINLLTEIKGGAFISNKENEVYFQTGSPKGRSWQFDSPKVAYLITQALLHLKLQCQIK